MLLVYAANSINFIMELEVSDALSSTSHELPPSSNSEFEF